MTEAIKPRRSWGRRVLIVAIVTVLLLFMVRAGVDFWAGHRVQGVEARLEQRYGSLDEGTMTVPSVAAGENRARAIRAAMALLDYPPQLGRDKLMLQAWRFESVHPVVPVPAELRAFVASNSAALRVAADARGRKQSNWEADYLRYSNVPSFLDIQDLSKAIYLAFCIDLEDGRADAAAASSASGLALSASMRQEPSLIAQLIRVDVAFKHFDGVQRLMIETEPSRDALEELARRLAENRTPDPMDLGLRAELRQFNGALRRLEDGELMANGRTADLLPASVARMTGAGNSPYWLGPLARLSRPLVRIGRVHYLEYMERALALQTGGRPRATLPDVPTDGSPFRWLDNMSILGIGRTLDSGDLFNSQLGLTELAVALRRFRIEHGQYPDALSALVPAYMANMPIDPATGKPPEYVRQGTGFRLRAEKGNASPYYAARLDWKVSK